MSNSVIVYKQCCCYVMCYVVFIILDKILIKSEIIVILNDFCCLGIIFVSVNKIGDKFF